MENHILPMIFHILLIICLCKFVDGGALFDGILKKIPTPIIIVINDLE